MGHDDARGGLPVPTDDRRSRALVPGWKSKMRWRSVEPTIQRTRLVQRLSKPRSCLGLDRGPHLGQRSWCRVNQAGHM